MPRESPSLTQKYIDGQIERMNRNLCPGVKAELNGNYLFFVNGNKKEMVNDFFHDTKKQVYDKLHLMNVAIEAKDKICK